MPRTSWGNTFLRQVGFVLETILWVEVELAPEQQSLDAWLSEIHPHSALPNSTEIEVRTTLVQLLAYLREYGKYSGQFNQLFVPGPASNLTIRKRNLERLRSVLYRMTELGYFKRLLGTKKEECHFFLILPGLDDITNYKDWLRTQLPNDWAAKKQAGPRQPQNTLTSPIIGRRKEIKAVKDYFRSSVRLIVLYGLPGAGKTVLANQALSELGFSKIYRLTARPDPYLHDWLKSQVGGAKEPLTKWKTHLTQHKAALVIEGFQACLDEHGYIRQDCQAWLEFLDAQRWAEGWLTIITCSQLIAESKVTSRSLFLTGLEIDDWRTDWNQRQIQVLDSTLEAIHQAYGGHPKAMRIVGNLISQHYQGLAETFWAENQAKLLSHPQLEDLFERQWQPIQANFPQQFQRIQKTLSESAGCFVGLESTDQELLNRYLLVNGAESKKTLTLAQLMVLDTMPTKS